MDEFTLFRIEDMDMPQATGLQFTVIIGSLPSDSFSVISFDFTESLSDLFTGTLQLASTRSAIPATELLEQPVELVVWQDGVPLRRFHGVVNEYAEGDSGFRHTRYEVIIQPALWRLGLMHNSRIFQGQAPDAIIRTLLEERGLVDTRFDLRRPPEEKEYCVQHRESDLAFLQRLAAEEGWHFRYHHGSAAGRGAEGEHDEEDTPALVFADHHGDAPRLAPVAYNTGTAGRSPAGTGPGGAGEPEKEAANEDAGSEEAASGTAKDASGFVWTFSHQQRVRTASVALKDYTFRNPAYALLHDHQAGPLEAQRESYSHYDYPGRFKADASGQPFTRARLDALRNDARTAEGKGNRADFTAGARVKLTDHDTEALNRDWLLTAVTHTGKQPQALAEDGGSGATTYKNTFQAVPADKTWRPHPDTVGRPRMNGPQIAIVTGPEGEEIHCDEYGRVKVRFPWDRYSKNDEHSSAWLRVSQGWAGGQYGFMALPRIGHEVIVSFLDGDPDQPIITGRTYHATNQPPYPLLEHKTRTVLKTQTHKGEGSNELRFEDEADREQVYLHAQKDLDLLTEHNRTETIHNDSHLTVGNHRTSHIKGNDHTLVEGERRDYVEGDCSLDVGGTFHQQSGQGTLGEAGTEVHHKAGGKVVLDAGAELTIAAGGSFLKLDASGVTLSGPGLKINSGGAPGSGSGQSVKVPERPVLLERSGMPVSAPAELAEVQVRPLGKPDKTMELLEVAAADGLALVDKCMEQPDGSCPLTNCPCREDIA